MKQIVPLILILFVAITPSSICQSVGMAGKWINYSNESSSSNLLTLVSMMPETFAPDTSSNFENSPSGTICYWDGREWIIEGNTNEPSKIGIVMRIGKNGAIIIGAPLNQSVSEYDVFTTDGWVHVKSQIEYIPDNDKLYYDEENNRFILLKGNTPWVFKQY